jgi:hypothetical protein
MEQPRRFVKKHLSWDEVDPMRDSLVVVDHERPGLSVEWCNRRASVNLSVRGVEKHENESQSAKTAQVGLVITTPPHRSSDGWLVVRRAANVETALLCTSPKQSHPP